VLGIWACSIVFWELEFWGFPSFYGSLKLESNYPVKNELEVEVPTLPSKEIKEEKGDLEGKI